MIEILLHRKYYKVPENWNELTSEQLIAIMDALYIKPYAPVELLVKLLKILTGINDFRFSRLKPEELDDYLYLTGFVFKKMDLTKQLLPFHRGLYGPEDEMGNMVMCEFVFTEHYYMAWEAEQTNIELLDQLVAVLYRPAKKNYDFSLNPDGDCRVPYNQHVCSWYGKQIINGWDHATKLAIAKWYSGCRQQLVEENPDVFGGTGEEALHGIVSIIRSVAKENTHGNFSDVEQMKVSLLMIELNESIAEAKKMEEQMKATSL